jgi:hypothetical protein
VICSKEQERPQEAGNVDVNNRLDHWHPLEILIDSVLSSVVV